MGFQIRIAKAVILVPLLVACHADDRHSQPSALNQDDSALWPSATDPAGQGSVASDGDKNPWILGWGGAATDEEGAPRTTRSDDPIEQNSPNPSPAIEGEPSEPGVEPSQPPAAQLQRRLVGYWEGAGSEKMLTLWGEAGVSSQACLIEIYSNGGLSAWRSLALPGEFPPDGIVGLCNDAADDPLCTHPLSGSVFNGNDALVLRCGDTVLDSFGRLGEDPGTAWVDDTLGLRSEGQRLLRCAEALDPEPLDAFVIGDQWRSWEPGLPAAGHPCDKTNENGGAGGAPIP